MWSIKLIWSPLAVLHVLKVSKHILFQHSLSCHLPDLKDIEKKKLLFITASMEWRVLYWNNGWNIFHWFMCAREKIRCTKIGFWTYWLHSILLWHDDFIGVFLDFEDFRCTNWAKGQHFGGHVRDVSFRHPVKVYFGKVPLQNSILYNFVISNSYASVRPQS